MQVSNEGLRREDLERLAAEGCTVPGCQHTLVHSLFLHASCHPAAGMRVEYQQGLLRMRCRDCAALVAVVVVAGQPWNPTPSAPRHE